VQKFYKTVSRIIEAIATPPPPPPPALIQRADDTKLTFDDILKFIKKHEGVKPHIYRDSLGIPTVGIGFNMLRPDARAIFHKHNLDYDNVLNGSINLSEDQMHSLFQTCLQIAYADVKHYIPSFDALPRNIKLGLIDLSFNLGYGRLSKFVKTREYILKGNYKQAAAELENSKWAKQVGKRSKDIISLFVAA
jgi:GH24 family phage-related lysozyme (muramidase)